jgi:hypothetical protein
MIGEYVLSVRNKNLQLDKKCLEKLSSEEYTQKINLKSREKGTAIVKR